MVPLAVVLVVKDTRPPVNSGYMYVAPGVWVIGLMAIGPNPKTMWMTAPFAQLPLGSTSLLRSQCDSLMTSH